MSRDAVVFGIDPGLTGAIAALDIDTGDLLDVWDMPAIDGHVTGSALATILNAPGSAAWVEAVHSMPGQGVASTFKFGRSVGVVLGVLGALHIPTHHVTPAVWKRAAGLTKDKAASRRRAVELWPAHAHLFARVKDDGRAEAALIARHGWTALYERTLP